MGAASAANCRKQFLKNGFLRTRKYFYSNKFIQRSASIKVFAVSPKFLPFTLESTPLVPAAVYTDMPMAGPPLQCAHVVTLRNFTMCSAFSWEIFQRPAPWGLEDCFSGSSSLFTRKLLSNLTGVPTHGVGCRVSAAQPPGVSSWQDVFRLFIPTVRRLLAAPTITRVTGAALQSRLAIGGSRQL